MTTSPDSAADAAASPAGGWADTLYERLAEDDEGRVCKAIPEHACRVVPGNFLRMLAASALSRLADSLASAKTTLPWLLLHAGAPGWMAALLVPIRESGSMLPQLFIGAAVRGIGRRKWIWAGAGLIQALSLAGLGWTAMALEGASAGWSVLLLLAVFSLARGGCSIAYKDVQGKTIPKTRRGRLSGWIAALAGALAMAVGLGLGLLPEDSPSGLYAGLLLGAAALWAAAAAVFARIDETAGETEGGVDGWDEMREHLALLRDDAPFRHFVIGRALAMGSGLAAPFFVALARDAIGDALMLLGWFIALEGLAGLVSSPIWGRWADRSSRRVFGAASALAAALSIAVAFWAWADPGREASMWFYPLAFLGLGIAHAGVRLGRKTYLVDLAEGERRTAYVAVSNSAIGALLLATGALGALAATRSVPGTVLMLGLSGALGALMSLRWREVSG